LNNVHPRLAGYPLQRGTLAQVAKILYPVRLHLIPLKRELFGKKKKATVWVWRRYGDWHRL
jgi:hypothetical protein